MRTAPGNDRESDFFDGLPNDLIVCILCKLSSTTRCPSDFINVLITCKRLNGLGFHPLMLSKASPKAFAVKSKNWFESSHRFLKQCADICFYCLQNRGNGVSLMAKAAISSHAPALYSLAVIQFNGTTFLSHIDAFRELVLCLQDGYGVRQNIAEGRRFLVQASTVNYYSWACQTLDWKLCHKVECAPMEQWLGGDVEADGGIVEVDEDDAMLPPVINEKKEASTPSQTPSTIVGRLTVQMAGGGDRIQLPLPCLWGERERIGGKLKKREGWRGSAHHLPL
uniref:Uncharacterized protein n=1 Tax=Nelumbo nucifera TaxID=4432 RepID=A0A822ZI77_NELNU|nr:TPA_asm: hypothetical protein HUJ06_003072 [Nelumbo nucifera]